MPKVFFTRTPDASGCWIAVNLILGSLVALIGGGICGSISPRLAPLCTLAGLAVVIGLAYAGMELVWLDSGLSSEVGWMEAQFVVQSPRWLLFANPAIDLVGILLGGAFAWRVMRARDAPLVSTNQQDSGPTPGTS